VQSLRINLHLPQRHDGGAGLLYLIEERLEILLLLRFELEKPGIDLRPLLQFLRPSGLAANCPMSAATGSCQKGAPVFKADEGKIASSGVRRGMSTIKINQKKLIYFWIFYHKQS
jgi:hypothetical protein